MTLTATEFRALSLMIWGEDWRGAVGEFLHVGERRLSYWLNGDREIPDGVADELYGEIERRRDDPSLERLRSALEGEG